MIPYPTTEVKNKPENTSTGSAFPTSLDSNRHIFTSDRQRGVYTALVGLGETGKAESYMSCGEELYTLRCERCGFEHAVQYNCKLRFCSRCASVKVSGYMKKYLPYVKSLPCEEVRFATLTIVNVEDLREGVQRIRACFAKLRRWKYYRCKIKGGLYGEQAEPDGRGRWNVHLHFIYHGSYIPQARLSEDWQAITGDSMIVDIRRSGRPSDALRYVLRYIMQGIGPDAEGWTGKELVGFVLALSDVRLIQAFGCFLGKVAEKEPFACPECGACFWRRLDADGGTLYSPLEYNLRELEKARPPPMVSLSCHVVSESSPE